MSGVIEVCTIKKHVSKPRPDNTLLAYQAARILQSRGQEAAGIARACDDHLVTYKDIGLMTDVFPLKLLKNISGSHHYAVIGHVKGSEAKDRNIEPIELKGENGRYKIAIAKDGRVFENYYKIPDTVVETEILGRSFLLELEKTDNPKESVKRILTTYDRAYFSAVALIHDKDKQETKAIAFRDKRGVRPLCYGEMDGTYFISSESCAFSFPVNVMLKGDVNPGEYYEFSQDDMIREQLVPNQQKFCWFEYGYSSNRDTRHNDILVHSVRTKVGAALFNKYSDKFEGRTVFVVPNPESGRGVSEGFLNQAIKRQHELDMAVELKELIIKNPYTMRTYIIPDEKRRNYEGVFKFRTIAELVMEAIERDALIAEDDDSIVRFTVQDKILNNLSYNLYLYYQGEYELGYIRGQISKRLYAILGSPPLIKTCPDYIEEGKKAFIASNYPGMSERQIGEEIAKEKGFAGVIYPSIEMVLEATGMPMDKFCLYCFNKKSIFPKEIEKLEL